MATSFNQETRAASIATMARETVDLVVIGGGITGCGIARDAAMRGIRTALIDKGDFGSGTSSRTSRLIHGGLRYLETGEWRLVLQASRERRILLRIAPHLVRPRSFVFPVYAGGRVSRWKLAAGLWLYDLLALFGNVRPHRRLSKREVLQAEPGLRSQGLKGGARYFDAQCDDARLVLANARSAHYYGALVANYVEATEFLTAGGKICGVRAVDRMTGREFTIRALAVVNATGPWSDRVGSGSRAPLLRPTKGAHVVVRRDRLGNREAVVMISPIDGRVMFILPWGELSYIGTTDTDCGESPDEVRATAADVIYLLRSANAYYPAARLSLRDVLSTWAGLRPLLRSNDQRNPSQVTREHKVVESPDGLVTVAGGKLTTYRLMAAEAVDLVARRLHQLDGRPIPKRAPTDREPLPGGEARDLGVIAREIEEQGFSSQAAAYLVGQYGTEAMAVVRLARSDKTLNRPVVPGHPAILAELFHAIDREMALTLCDLLIRRTHVFYETDDHAVAAAPVLVDLVGEVLRWDAQRKAAELAAYLHEVERTLAFREEITAGAEAS
ncbi:MAG: glycerol-3-phosphate dehydrogenase [Gemmatimonadales bacterium]|nr:MAG: glycerol-3-phosphate dehydrogenase [Gemmatimonadales bacterium]